MKRAVANNWSNRQTLIAQLEKLWQRGELLRQLIEVDQLFPKRLVFKAPNSKALSEQFDAVRQWIVDIQQLNGFRFEYKTVQHRIIGENRLPAEAWIDDLTTAISLLKKTTQSQRFRTLIEQTKTAQPTLIHWIKQQPIKALEHADVWPKLLQLVAWRLAHPTPKIYLRQVTLRGIDSKFIEQHRMILSALFDAALPEEQINHTYSGVKQFAQRYGFLHKPERIRFRLLDPTLTLLPGNQQDITLNADDFRALEQHPEISNGIQRIYITENEINFLAFPAQANSLVIFGAGYGFDALAQASWLQSREIHYWGDIDSHGFAILDQLRSKFPHVKSLLMDQQTLLDHQAFWGQESKAEHKTLSRLTTDEQALYQALINNEHKAQLRLEQERIGFDYLLNQLEK